MMKKLSVMLMVFVFFIGLVGSALAAENSYADVPAGHWSYDAVKKLSEAGIVEGYKDGTFRGSSSITRYEMAQIVANAMTKLDKVDDKNKALIEKMQQEYSPELQNLGIRVSKLEKNFKDASLGGEIRFLYNADNPSSDFPNQKIRSTDQFLTRVRIWYNMPIDDKTSMYVRLGTPRFVAGLSAQNAGVDSFEINLKDQLGVNSLRFGRIGNWGCGYGFLEGKSGGSDGAYFEKKVGPQLTWRGTVLDARNSDNPNTNNVKAHEFTGTSLYFDNGKNSGGQIGYYWSNDIGKAGTTLNVNNGSFDSSKGYMLGVHQDLGNWFLLGEYVGTTLDKPVGLKNTSPKAWALELRNGIKNPRFYPITEIVDYKKPHTDAWAVQYMHVETGSIPFGEQPYTTWHKAYSWPGNVNVYDKGDNMNIFSIVYQNVIRKNVIATFEYADIRIDDKASTSLTNSRLDQCYKLMIAYNF